MSQRLFSTADSHYYNKMSMRFDLSFYVPSDIGHI